MSGDVQPRKRKDKKRRRGNEKDLKYIEEFFVFVFKYP